MSNKKRSRFGWYVIWVLTHFVTLLLLAAILKKIDLGKDVYDLLFLGFGITLIATNIRNWYRRKYVVVDKWFLFFSLLNACLIWVSFLCLKSFNISNHLAKLFITAVILVAVTVTVKKFNISKVALWGSVVVMCFLLFFVQNSNPQSISFSTNNFLAGGSDDILSSITSIVESPILGNCPQINVPINGYGPSQYFLDIKEYDGWELASYDTNLMLGINFGKIYCHYGSKEGQNPVYLYCGDETDKTTMAFMKKTMAQADGTVGKTVQQSFYNVYDEHQKFVKTVCGKDPDAIVKEQYKQWEKEMAAFLG